LGSCEAEDLPFAFSGEAWKGTRYDGVGDDNQWVLSIDGWPGGFDLRSVDLRHPSAYEGPGVCEFLKVETSGSSRSTGPIGLTTTVDDAGNCWAADSGCFDTYLGRFTPTLTALEAIGDARFDGVATISSEVLRPRQLRDAVKLLCEGVSLSRGVTLQAASASSSRAW